MQESGYSAFNMIGRVYIHLKTDRNCNLLRIQLKWRQSNLSIAASFLRRPSIKILSTLKGIIQELRNCGAWMEYKNVDLFCLPKKKSPASNGKTERMHRTIWTFFDLYIIINSVWATRLNTPSVFVLNWSTSQRDSGGKSPLAMLPSLEYSALGIAALQLWKRAKQKKWSKLQERHHNIQATKDESLGWLWAASKLLHP